MLYNTKRENMAERGIMMVFHSIIIGLIVYAIFMEMGVPQEKSENRSVLLGGVALIYMVLFDHDDPTAINKALI